MNNFMIFVFLIVINYIEALPFLESCMSNANGRMRIRRSPEPAINSFDSRFCEDRQITFESSCIHQLWGADQNDFCSTYGQKCRGWKQPKPAQESGAISPGHVKYCQNFGKDYYKLCLRGEIPDFAYKFCTGYKTNCPGVPDPGTEVIPPPPSPIPKGLPPTIPPVAPANPLLPASVVPSAPQLPPSVPSNPNLPAGALSPLPSSPSLPAGGLPSVPISPTGTFPQPGLQQTPQIGGFTPGGIGFGSGVGAPFFSSQSGTNISPLSGVGTGTALNAAGIGVGTSRGVNYGGLPFLSGVNQYLNGVGRRKRR